DVFVADDLDPVPPRVEEIEEGAGQGLDSRFLQRGAHRFLVIDDKAEVTAVIRGLPAPRLQCQELVAEINEGGVLAPTSQFEAKESAVKLQRLVDIPDLERHMVDSNGACSGVGHQYLPWLQENRYRPCTRPIETRPTRRRRRNPPRPRRGTSRRRKDLHRHSAPARPRLRS